MLDGDPTSAWREVPYEDAWAPFTERFGFRPDFYEQDVPAIEIPDGALVLDLGQAYYSRARFEAAKAAVDAAALRALVWVAPEDEWLALDWQHPTYAYTPSGLALAGGEWPVRVFPDGDYFAHLRADLSTGTFGHPWQRTLTIWGDDLVGSLGADLLTWLPRHRQSQA
jgi:hypothetical protein